ncbi:MAG: MBL fold metallo-hydrolase [Clostridia bacterium]|nr:MBL fold metallo-hydrolase [Clostridia bacterium]
MKITFLGQASLLFETEGKKILIDPYFSDSVGAMNEAKHRRVPVEDWLFRIRPDVILFTHCHIDHYDPETAEKLLKGAEGITVLGPMSVWQEARKLGGNHNYVMFSPGTHWTEGKAEILAVPACHSDPDAIGAVICAEGKKYYVTGDTLYNESIFPALPESLEAVFVPVNGQGNNMNAVDAEHFAERCKARFTVPLHVGMLDDMTPDIYKGNNRVLPEIYKEIKL